MSDVDKLLDQIKNLDSMATLDTPIPGMKVINDKIIKITAGKLRLALESNPTHPVAVVYQRVVSKVPDASSVSVSRVDLQCLIEDKEVLLEDDLATNEVTKTVGPARSRITKSASRSSSKLKATMSAVAVPADKPQAPPPPPPKKS